MSQVLLYQQCPICSSSDLEFSLSAKDYTVSSELFEIWKCNNCSAKFTQNVPRETEIGKYYQSEEYVSHSNTQKGLINRLYHIVRNYTLDQKFYRVKKVSGLTKGIILDIGCGTGEFLNRMKKGGWTTVGLEPDDNARKNASENYNLEVFPSSSLLTLENNKFDAVSMWHVLEHVHQLHKYLEQIHKTLKESGVLLIAVPNYTSSDADHYRENWAAYDVPRHLYHFSPQSMGLLLNKHGFKLEKTLPMAFDSFYVSLLSEKYKGSQVKLIPGFWFGFLSYLKMLGDVNKGSSILYVAKKK